MEKAVFDRWEVIESYVRHKDVADAGCAELIGTVNVQKKSRWLHNRLKEAARDVVGFDLNQDQVTELNRQGYNVVCGDIESVRLDRKFDVVVLGELIEHLSNPGRALENIKGMLKSNGLLIITTPNRFDFLQFIRAFFKGRIPVYNKDIAKHVFYFDENCLKDLLLRHGYDPIKTVYYASFSKDYDSFFIRAALMFLIKVRPSFMRGLVVVAEIKKS